MKMPLLGKGRVGPQKNKMSLVFSLAVVKQNQRFKGAFSFSHTSLSKIFHIRIQKQLISTEFLQPTLALNVAQDMIIVKPCLFACLFLAPRLFQEQSASLLLC